MSKVAYVLLGHLPYISRAKKQLNTLAKLDFQVDVFNGIMTDKVPYEHTEYFVNKRSIVQSRFRTLNFLRVVQFDISVGRIMRKKNYDFIVCRELSTLLAGVLAKRKNIRVRLIFDNNELSVERYSGIKKMTWGMLQRIFLPLCDIVFHAEINRLQYFIKKYRVEDKTNILLENYPIRGRPNTFKNSSVIRAVYFGGIGKGRNLEEVIHAFASIPGAELDIVGYGTPEYISLLRRLIGKESSHFIRILPPVSDQDLDAFFMPYTLGLAFYPNNNLNNYYCAPNKVFQYIQAGLAVITNDYPGLKSLVEGRRIGCCIGSINRDELSKAVRTIADERRHLNITETLKDELSWERLEPKFMTAFADREVERRAL